MPDKVACSSLLGNASLLPFFPQCLTQGEKSSNIWPADHSYKKIASRRQPFIPPGTPQHACGSLSISRLISECEGKAVPACSRGSCWALSLPGHHCTRWQMSPTAAPGGPHSREDGHQAGYAALEAQQHPSHFLLHWIQEKWEQRDVFCQNHIQESLHTLLCLVGIYFQVQSAVHHNNIFNKISRKWDDNKTMIF